MHTSRPRTPAARRRELEAARLAKLAARDRAEAALSFEDYLEAVSAYAIVDPEDVPALAARHAELVNLYR